MGDTSFLRYLFLNKMHDDIPGKEKLNKLGQKVTNLEKLDYKGEYLLNPST